ncbi:MAG TPA: gamma-glutamylcyclotransferase family protein [Longimicrobiales bacterium]|nr:gamma-glutamylcyclotransferase family protein [Longimicrobiales bacterium]
MSGETFDLFVYGTLRSGEPAAELLAGAEPLGPARVEGTLYDIDGRYPALMLAGRGVVEGEVWRCPVELLWRLDEYEGVEEGLFRRVGVRVGERACWTYVVGPTLARRLTAENRVAGGRWAGA